MSTYFKHPTALVESKSIGKKTRIWAYTHVLPQARIGEDVNICDFSFIENDVIIGNRVTIKAGVHIWDGVTIEDAVFIGPSAAFTNDFLPRSKNPTFKPQETLLKEGCSIGANATIIVGVTIGKHALVGGGSVITKNVPDFALVYGNPARAHGFVCVCAQKLLFKSGKKATCECGRSFKKTGNSVQML